MPLPYRAVRDWPEDERPRERLMKYGVQCLGDAELMAIVLRTGLPGSSAVDLARKVLRDFDDSLAKLADAHPSELPRGRSGLGPAKAAQLVAAIELGRRAERASPREIRRLGSPEDVAGFLGDEMRYLAQEEVRVVLINARNAVLSQHSIYRGSVTTAQVRVAELFKPAVREDAVAIVLAHNHPSGDPTPSSEDVHLTKSVIAAGEALGIEVLDHVIIARSSLFSMKRKKVAFG